MAINTEIQRIQTAKTNLKAAIEAKGVTVPSDTLISDYFEYVEDIQTAEGLRDLIERDITYINIPSGTTTIGANAFTKCEQLVTVVMPSSVTSIATGCFAYCSNLLDITLSPNVTTIGNSAFISCAALTNITFPVGVTEIGNSAFDSCTGLAVVTCEATTPPTLGSSVFRLAGVQHIYVPAASVEAYKTTSGWSDYTRIIEAIPSAE